MLQKCSKCSKTLKTVKISKILEISQDAKFSHLLSKRCTRSLAYLLKQAMRTLKQNLPEFGISNTKSHEITAFSAKSQNLQHFRQNLKIFDIFQKISEISALLPQNLKILSIFHKISKSSAFPRKCQKKKQLTNLRVAPSR